MDFVKRWVIYPPPPFDGGTGKGAKTTQIANIHRNKLSEKDVVYLERRDPALLLPKKKYAGSLHISVLKGHIVRDR